MEDFGKEIYREAKRWGLWLWIFILFLYLTLVIALLVSINTGATLVFVIPLFAVILFYWFHTALKIKVTKGWLLVHKAKIKRAFIAEVEALDANEFRVAAGREFNANAYLQNRPWLKGGVKIYLRDPKDPTPYWLIASKNPEKLARVLNSQSED
jgi:hypothetical protein